MAAMMAMAMVLGAFSAAVSMAMSLLIASLVPSLAIVSQGLFKILQCHCVVVRSGCGR